MRAADKQPSRSIRPVVAADILQVADLVNICILQGSWGKALFGMLGLTLGLG